MLYLSDNNPAICTIMIHLHFISLSAQNAMHLSHILHHSHRTALSCLLWKISHFMFRQFPSLAIFASLGFQFYFTTIPTIITTSTKTTAFKIYHLQSSHQFHQHCYSPLTPQPSPPPSSLSNSFTSFINTTTLLPKSLPSKPTFLKGPLIYYSSFSITSCIQSTTNGCIEKTDYLVATSASNYKWSNFFSWKDALGESIRITLVGLTLAPSMERPTFPRTTLAPTRVPKSSPMSTHFNFEDDWSRWGGVMQSVHNDRGYPRDDPWALFARKWQWQGLGVITNTLFSKKTQQQHSKYVSNIFKLWDYSCNNPPTMSVPINIVLSWQVDGNRG